MLVHHAHSKLFISSEQHTVKSVLAIQITGWKAAYRSAGPTLKCIHVPTSEVHKATLFSVTRFNSHHGEVASILLLAGAW